MTPTLAKYIGDNFTVVTHIETSDVLGSGFDATVWKDNATGKLTVSMQGTEGLQDFLVDADLAVTGNARSQIVDMVNWWFRISTPAGQSARQITLEPIYDSATPPNLLGTHYAAAPDVAGSGLISAADLAQGIEVNGHSLGGYLATAFTRLFGSQAHVSHTSTFNSAGFASGSEAVFTELQNLIGPSYGLGRYPSTAEQSNYFAQNGLNFTTNSFYFNQQGQRVELFNELDATQLGNHYLYKLTDALALGNALSTLDASFTTDKLNLLLAAGSNKTEGSIEGVLDSLRRYFQGSDVAATQIGDVGNSAPSRADYYSNLDALQKLPAFQSLAGQLTVKPTTGSNLRATARNSFAALIALQDLSPVYIGGKDAAADAVLATVWQSTRASDYAAWTADKSSATPTTFTDNWIADRAAMLAAIVYRNQYDSSGVLTPNPAQGIKAGHYLDLASNTDLTVGLDVSTTREFAFGGDAADTLFGRSAEDHLYGGAGDDTLNGQGGNDYLEGGVGADTYNFTSSFGKDTVFDADGLGAIQIDGTTIGTAKGIGERGAWAFDLGAGVYAGLAVYDDARSSTGKRLVITKGTDTGNTITIDNFDLTAAQGSQGYLGIKLDNTAKLAIREGGGSNVWGDLSFDPASLTGASAITEGNGKTFTLYLNAAANANQGLRV
ncbi:MAG: calcium-binding protein [Polaromonas sp.]